MAIDRKALKAMAAKHKDRIKGGKADKAKPHDFDPKELAMGIEVEAEHTGDPQTAMEIAMDHLKEFPDYYTRLKKMEREAETVKKESTMDMSLSLNWLEQLREAIDESAGDVAIKRVRKLAQGTPVEKSYGTEQDPRHELKRQMRVFAIGARHEKAKGIARRAKEKLKAMTPQNSSLEIMRARYQAFMEAGPPPIPADARRRKPKLMGQGTRTAGGVQPGSDLDIQLKAIRHPEKKGMTRVEPSGRPAVHLPGVHAPRGPSGAGKAMAALQRKIELVKKAKQQTASVSFFGPVLSEWRAVLTEISGPEHMHQEYLRMKDKHLRSAADTARAIASKVTPPERQASLRKLHRKQIGWAKEMHQQAAAHRKKHGLG